MNKITKAAIAVAALISAPAFAGYEVQLDDNQKLTFGGYFKADIRNVNGDQAYQDLWVGNSKPKADTNKTSFHARESRFNVKYQNGDVTGFLEYDFITTAAGNNKVSNSYTPRMRHAFISYKNWKVGQTWSTFMPLASIAEALDFGGAHVGQVFIRQGQVRYTTGGLELALENPTSEDDNQSIPDVVARYTVKGDWGLVSVAGLARTFDDNGVAGKADGTQFAYSLSGKIKTFGKDDFRFAYNAGAAGRYVSPGHSVDKVDANGDLLDIQAYTVAYRHFWTDSLRSSLYYGHSEVADYYGTGLDSDRSHYGINLIKQLNKQLSVGVEYGNYEADANETTQADSDYVQVSVKYVL